MHAVITKASWKSLAADANLVLAHGATVPVGTLSARMTRLADLAPLIGQELAGSLTAKIATMQAGGRSAARVEIEARDIAAARATLARLSLTGTLRDPADNPELALVLAAEGLSASGIAGRARITADGPQTALLLRTTASLTVSDTPATLAASARLDAKARQVTLQALTADYKGEALRLRAPARIVFGATTAVDQLRLALSGATLDVAGRVAPTLSLTAAIRNVTPELARPFAPGLQAAGLLTADARLTGTAAAPLGSVRVQASGVRMRTGPGASLPAASLLATADLRGTSARLDAHINAGPKLQLSASGTAPLQAGGPLAITATGTADLRLFDPVLNASGQRAAGNLALDTTLTGTAAAPRIDGGVTLDHGELQDFVQGVHITDISARLAAAGDTVRIERFEARAGRGSLAASGSVGVLAPGLPVDVHLTADHAQPLASDLLTATLDADLTVRGQAAGEMQAAGRVFVRRADINIPNALPPSVAVLRVRRPGDTPPPPPTTAPASVVRLALEVDAPSGIFVRGHGLDSELGGKLTVGGSSTAPQIGGGFRMRRGTISIAGTTLTFSKGEVGFDGTGVTNKIDPSLDFVADSISGNVTATLTVGGYADAPKITLSSVPDLPQDEVLAHLLFGTSVKDLSAIQIAEIGAALAELSGVGGGGGDPLGAVRKGLGLDRLSVGGGGGSSGTGASVEAGRYVARGVYVGAKQATSAAAPRPKCRSISPDVSKRARNWRAAAAACKDRRRTTTRGRSWACRISSSIREKVMADELVFYTHPMSRGRIARWMLEEVGAPYRTELMGYGPQLKGPDFLAINPMGKVPALRHRGQTVTETAAICAYLADAFPQAALAPPPDSPMRAGYYRWLFFAAGAVEAAIINQAMKVEVPAQMAHAVGYGTLALVTDVIEAAVTGREYLVGDQFSAADVYLASQVGWGLKFGTVEARPALIAYFDRLQARPAAKRAVGIDDALIETANAKSAVS